MYFDATPINVTILLVVVLAVVAVSMLYHGRYASNLPLLFYAAAFVMSTASDRGINPYILYTGIALALVLRFEFMSKGFTKFFAFLSATAIALAALAFLDQVFTNGAMFS